MNTSFKTTRREFVKTTSAAVLGVSLTGLEVTPAVAAPAGPSKILNYSPDMEYRRCGKTGWMVSAVAMGGHWKRINQIIGGEVMDPYSGDGHPAHRTRCQLHRRLQHR
jgi:hypothetical protein